MTSLVRVLQVFIVILNSLRINGQKLVPFNTPCERNYVIDLSAGKLDVKTKNIIYNHETYTPDKYFKHKGATLGCVCDVELCVSKCCFAGQGKLNESASCVDGFPRHIQVDLSHDDLGLKQRNVTHQSITDWKECQGILLEPTDVYHILQDGRLYYPDDQRYFQLHEYCLAYYEDPKGVAVQLCYDNVEQVSETTIFHIYGMIFSIPFLLATLLVYLLLPDKKIQTKCLMAYVTCLMLSYFFLVFLQFQKNLGVIACEAVAACGIYFFMATFCWMNITCVDMYLTFSGKRAIIQNRSSNWKRFGMYCLFANGAPLILLSVILGLNKHEKNYWYHPKFADGKCWLEDGIPQLLYFYGPMAFLLVINTGLFIFTAFTIRRTMVESQKMLRSKESQKHFDSNRQDYKLYIKLFIAMGINWIMEFISWIVDWSLGSNKVPAVWYLTDFCNAIYGFFIFFIFVCKRTIWIKLKQRYYIFMGKPNMARALSSRTSGYQMTQTEKTNIEDTTTTVTDNYNNHH